MTVITTAVRMTPVETIFRRGRGLTASSESLSDAEMLAFSSSCTGVYLKGAMITEFEESLSQQADSRMIVLKVGYYSRRSSYAQMDSVQKQDRIADL